MSSKSLLLVELRLLHIDLYNFETTRLDLLFYSLPVRLLWNVRRHIWLVRIETVQHCCLKILTFQDHCLSFHLYVHLATTTDGVSPLWVASYYGNVDTVKVLIKAGGNVNQAKTTTGL